MKERPILFSAPMVRAILAGQKTQTRRIVKPVRGFEHHNICRPDMMADSWSVWWHGGVTDRVGCSQDCPYGKPGDRLWVRETWRTRDCFDKTSPSGIAAKAEAAGFRPGAPIIYEADGFDRTWGDNDAGDFGAAGKIRQSIFMPRWASRITLEITAVRVERLQEITEGDALAEGVDWRAVENSHLGNVRRSHFTALWESINGKDSWTSNPWVWVISVKQIEASK
jgi:hypothetical protein